EPDGILETGEEFIQWYEQELMTQAIPAIRERFHADEQTAGEMLRQHVCLCYDVCHFAIGYEPHQDIIRQLQERGIRIGKFQISAALKAAMDRPDSRTAAAEAFAGYNEPVYLHQVVARTATGEVIRYRDLPQALEDVHHTAANEW